MLEAKRKLIPGRGELTLKKLHFFIDSSFVSIEGTWDWDLHADEIFCSNVMFVLYSGELPGTKCLIHPDDLKKVQTAIFAEREMGPSLSLNISFRAITSYGEIKTIKGKGSFSIEEKDDFTHLVTRRQLEDVFHKKQLELISSERGAAIKAYQYADTITHQGIFYFNQSTYEAFYSDIAYRIHGLPPQGLNAHLHTFSEFVHPAEKDIVTSAMDDAYRQHVPLSLEYRIVLQTGEEKWVRNSSKWIYNDGGERVMLGVLEDVTENKSAEQQSTVLQEYLDIKNRLLLQDEQMTRTASWQINLLTRQFEHSDNLYRIYGTKPGTVLNQQIILSFVHPDDQDKVREYNELLHKESAAAEIEFRILRGDGKVKYVRQQSRLIETKAAEKIIIGTTQDITDIVAREKKLNAAEDFIALQKKSIQQIEQIAAIGYWYWNIASGETWWSNGIHELLGTKSGSVQLSQKTLLTFVHTDDRKSFSSRVTSIINNNSAEEKFNFRLLRRGEIHIISAHFTINTQDERQVFFCILEDVTKQQTLKQKLAEQEQFATVFSNSSIDSIIVTDTHNAVTWWNKPAEEKLGVKKEKALGKNIFDLLPQLKTDASIEYFNKALAGEEVLLRDIKSPFGQGFVHFNHKPVFNEQQAVMGVLTIISDVTKDYTLRQQLTQRVEFIEKLLEATVDRIIVLDKNMNYLYWNKRAEDYYGLKKEEVLNRNILEIFPAFLNDPSYSEFRQALRGETVYIPAQQNLGDDKGYFETYLIPIKNERKEVTSILWIVHDLIKEYLLQQQKAKENVVLDALNENYYELDADYRILFMNQRAIDFFGLTKEEVIGKLVWEVFPDAMGTWVEDASKNAMEQGISTRGEFISPTTNKWILASIAPTAEGVVALFFDIDEKKKTEEEILRLKDEVAQKATDKYKALFDSIDEGFAIMEVLADERRNVIDVIYREMNEVFEQHTGMKDALGKKNSEFVPNIEQSFLNDLTQVYQTGKPLRSEGYTADLDRWFSYHYARIGSAGGPLIAVVFNNITERKRREQKQAFLLRFSDALRAERTADAVANRALEMLIEYLRLDRSYIVSYYLDKDIALLDYQMGNETVPPLPDAFDLSHYPEAYKAVLEETFVIEDDFKRQGLSEVEKQNSAKLGMRAIVAATVRKGENNPLWSMVAISSTPRHWSVDEVQLVEEAAERTWAAIERAKAEEALSASEVRLQSIADLVPDLLWESEPDGYTTWYNHRWLEYTGQSLKEAIGWGWTKAIHPDDRERSAQRYNEAIKNGKQLRQEHRIRKHDGEYRWFVVNAYPEKDESGRVIKMYGAATDIHESQIMFEALRQSEEKLRTVFESIDEGFALIELIRNEEGKVVEFINKEANENFTTFTGLHNVVGKIGTELMPNFEQSILNLMQSVADRGEAIRTENFLVDLNRWFDTYWTPIGKPGDNYIVAVFKEITERKLQEQNQQFLIRFSDVLRTETDADAIANRALQMLAEHLKLDRCYVGIALLDDDRGIFPYQFGNEKVRPMPAQGVRLSDFPDALRKTFDETLVITDFQNIEGLTETEKKNFAALGFGALVVANVRKEVRNPDWAINAVSASPRQWTSSEISLIEQVTERTWAAIERAKSEEELKKLASSLETQVNDRTASLRNTTEELQKNLAILQHTEQMAQMGSWEYDIATEKFSWSSGMYALFGLPKHMKVQPETYLDFAVEQDRSVAKRIVANLRKKHTGFQEVMRIKKDSGERLLKITGSVLMNANNEPAKIVGVDLDITDIEEAQQKVKESEHWLKKTAETSPDSINIYDLQKKQPVYLNDCLAHWIGKTSQELIDMNIDGRLQLIHPDDRLPLLHFNERIASAEDGDTLSLEYRLKTDDGKMLWIRNRSKVFQRNAEGKVTHILTVLSDITEEKRIEQAFKELNAELAAKNKDLEKKNDEITSFAFVASHDLKEPLRKLYTFADLLSNKETLSDTGKKNLAKMHASIRRLDLLIDDILALSKIGAKNTSVAPVDLNEVLNRVLDDLDEQVANAGAVIEKDELPTINGDDHQLYYLFKNLISNSIKFQPKENKPVVTISAEHLQTAAQAGRFVRVSVHDNGIGFRQEYGQKIFNLFQRLHSRDDFEGTGIGLTICKKIMEKHGGYIVAESEPRKGAAFHCYFPC